MAGVNISVGQAMARGAPRSSRPAPRFLMRWEDWLTLIPALMVYLSVAYAARQADWVDGMPSLFPTVIVVMIIGLTAARIRGRWWYVHPIALAVAAAIVVVNVQGYASGETVFDRIGDFRFRMSAWIEVVRNGDVSNDDLPFVTLVHGVTALAAYTAAWAIYRVQNAWIAIVPAGVGLLLIIATLDGQPGGAFVVFMLGALLLLSRMYLQRRQEQWERAGIEYPGMISLSVVQITVLLAAGLVTLAWMVPLGKQADAAEAVVDRVVAPITERGEMLARLFPGISTGASGNFHTFGDTLAIRGDVDLGTRILAVAETEDGGFLRATSYDRYTGTGWRVGDRTTTEVEADDFSLDGTPVENYRLRRVTTLTVTSRDGEDTLYSLGIPSGADVRLEAEGAASFPGDVERLRAADGISSGDSYVVTGTVSDATPEDLAAASTAYPGWVQERYLQLPDSLPDRVRAVTEELVADAGTPYARAAAIESYLRTLPFDLSVASPPARGDIVDYFLFELRRGYFDYLSSAMAVMLRTVDVPSRVVVGYALDEENLNEDGSYTIRKDDSYSWVEVYFPEFGWVTFNPTPTRPGTAEELGGGGEGTGGGVGEFPEFEFDPNMFPAEFFDIPLDIPSTDPGTIPEATESDSGPGVPWTLIWSLAAVGAVVALGVVSTRLAWNWGLRGLEGTPRLWAKTQRLAGWAGIDNHDTETAREWSRRLGETTERGDDARALRDAYERERYGGGTTESDATPAYLQLRAALMNIILRRGRKPGQKE